MNNNFDINKFPKDWGLLVFPISMSRISTGQHQKLYIEWLEFFLDKITTNQVGAHFLYSEGLYMNFETDAFLTKNNFAQSAVSHKQGLMNLIEKNYKKFQITSAFSFESWFQMYLSHPDFFSCLADIRKVYEHDSLFQKYVSLDTKEHGKELDEKQLSFYLEEHLFWYLLSNRQLTINNDFVDHKEKWILPCYPGSAPRGQIYLFQLDPLRINKDNNPYKGQYDLSSKVFIDYSKIDLENYSI
jgi:hypothetical protein